MKNLLLKLPISLIYSRLVAGIVIIILPFTMFSQVRLIMVMLMAWALISDIFDGIIARKLGISDRRLRRLDSSVDQVFWIFTLIAIYKLAPGFYHRYADELIIIIGLEGLAYLISFIRFKKEVATHAILSKIWTLTLVATLIQVVITGQSVIIFYCCWILGLISRIEIIAILLILKEWANDVPGLRQAIALRNGRTIKRHKLFNG